MSYYCICWSPARAACVQTSAAASGANDWLAVSAADKDAINVWNDKQWTHNDEPTDSLAAYPRPPGK